MRDFRFDPSRLACSPMEQERRGHAVAARMLRDYLGDGDIFAGFRGRVRRDARLGEMFAYASELVRPDVERHRAENGRPVAIRRRRR